MLLSDTIASNVEGAMKAATHLQWLLWERDHIREKGYSKKLVEDMLSIIRRRHMMATMQIASSTSRGHNLKDLCALEVYNKMISNMELTLEYWSAHKKDKLFLTREV